MKKKIAQLIRLYCFICECNDTELSSTYQRFSPNSEPIFTDNELITCYLFALLQNQCKNMKESYEFILDYWGHWFPNLPSYQAFNNRLNSLKDYWISLVSLLMRIKGWHIRAQINQLKAQITS